MAPKGGKKQEGFGSFLFKMIFGLLLFNFAVTGAFAAGTTALTQMKIGASSLMMADEVGLFEGKKGK